MIIGLVLLAVAVLLGLSRCSIQQPAATRSPVPSSTPSVVAVPAQPDLHGYEYRVSRERYVLRQSEDSPLEVQTRLRESWIATTDGWEWARQTGSEPAHFIFAPSTDWQSIRQAPPDAAAIGKTLRPRFQATGLPPLNRSELDDVLFQFVYDEMAVAPLPDGALPDDYRQALVDLLAGLDGATRTSGVSDPEGRTATRITYVNQQAQPGMTRSLYFDTGNQFLAYEYTVDGTPQHGVHTFIERRIVAQIPDDVLAILGSDRVDQVIWQ